MLKSFSVIVPVLNKEDAIVRTLESVEASIQYFLAHHTGAPVTPEIVVVNEGSSDRTLERVEAFAQDKPHCKVISHFHRISAGAARNTGAKIAQGDLLFFCDGDDLYYPEHIYLCYRLLNHDPQNPTETTFKLVTKAGELTIDLPNQSIGVVRTGVHMADYVHPHWKMAIENSVPQNICVRRECHNFIEGFPEERTPYNEVTCEDISYQVWMTKFFKLLKVNLETVEYIRYPGNMFDQQLQKFQTPPEQYKEELTPEKRELHTLRHQIEQNHIAYLFEKLRRVDKSSEFLALMNWQQLGTDYMNQNKFDAAIPFFEYGLSVEPHHESTRNLLAAAYNNLGSSLRGQHQSDKATAYYQRSLALNPTFSQTDLARIHLNLAASLKEQRDYHSALIYAKKALEFDPTLSEIMTELISLKYYAHVAQRGYEYTQDWFSINIPVWEQQLPRFANQADLRVLEIGSWEGRSTCWLLDNILTHPTARITCVDTFAGSVEHDVMCADGTVQTIEQRFDANVAKTGKAEQVRKMIGASQTVLRSLIPNAYHLAYIDGSHVACDVLEDAVLTWRLVKVGGVIIFDDYGFRFPEGITEQPPQPAIDAFKTIFQHKVKLLHQGYQVLLEKIAE